MSDLGGKEELIKKRDITLNSIVKGLLEPEDIELKTEIYVPKDIASMLMIARSFDVDGFTIVGDDIRNYIKDYLELNVSKDRQGRSEVVKAVQSLLERDKVSMSFSQKLNRDV